MSLHDAYFAYCEEHVAKYGERTVVLMEVGSFFEMYCVENDTERIGTTLFEASDVLNLQRTKKNKSIPEVTRSNPYLAGFPSHMLSRHGQTLVAAGFTVVVVRQVTAPPRPRREITEIMSPGMQLTPSGADGNYMVVCCWDVHEDALRRRLLAVGLAGMDISTGRTWVYEVASTPKDPHLALDEFVRLIQTYPPREVVLVGADLVAEERERVESAVGAGYDASRSYHRRWDAADVAPFRKVAYQNEVLERVRAGYAGALQPLEAMGLERYEAARLAFVYMIQFGYEHNEQAIRCLQPPTHEVREAGCTLEYNSATQLNVVGGDMPLLRILNRCATAFGARCFRERLLQPVRDAGVLERRYDAIARMLEDDRHARVHAALRGTLDLERLARRMHMGTFSPCDWPGYDASLAAVLGALEHLGGGAGDAAELVRGLKAGYAHLLDMDECAKHVLADIRGNVFRRGVHPAVDALQSACTGAMDAMTAIVALLQDAGAEGCRVESNERDGHAMVTTKRRWELAQQTWRSQSQSALSVSWNGRVMAVDVGAFHAKPAGQGATGNVRIRHPVFDKAADAWLKHTQLLGKAVTEEYRAFLAAYIAQHRDALLAVVQRVAEVDVAATCARNAAEYHYVRPCTDADRLRIQAMRHPILERILERQRYVPNDITLGGRDGAGMLLFGMNASGKSSLMKAVGLNVLMAQAGMYVAAEAMELRPFRHIFTRISSGDNIYRGWSTFTVEMLELRNILQRCDAESLVLGDELCAGTEALSALSIVSAGIEVLIERGTPFVFATHLHDLAGMPRSAAWRERGVAFQHMHVEVCPRTGRILYDRRLRDGSGSAKYGLEVCKGLGLPAEFLRVAHEVRCELEGMPSAFVSPTKSRYNPTVYVHECKLCGKARATETHHLVPQRDADGTGWIAAGFHKDRAFNLVPLCEACHLAVHHGDAVLRGYQQTSEGMHLDVEWKKTH